MVYLDHGATSYPKPPQVLRAVMRAMEQCANPGRGSHRPAQDAAETVFSCRDLASRLFHCPVDRVAFTGSCTQGLNTAIFTLVRPGSRVLISGFEHNAVVRPLYALGASVRVAGRRLFDPADTLNAWEWELKRGVDAAVFTLVSNVFGYRLPVEDMARLCRKYRVPFVVDAAQGAGMMELDFERLGADFLAMPGHKGLLGPMGTGLLLCNRLPRPLIYGGTGSDSENRRMPGFLPDRLEAGTMNVPGIAGLAAGMELVLEEKPSAIGKTEAALAAGAVRVLEKKGFQVFCGAQQTGTVSFRGHIDPETLCARLADLGIATRAGLHCAPLAHRSAGTLETGTLRLSFGYGQTEEALAALEEALSCLQ